ncbi:porin family protein [Eudoraea chungangensis]|uniref:porin family protein n=1 Tax=Eudoraea chungangensis TaxID=1481905 RepID=UPI0023ED3288|nr:porin family protein [Eudoraea chungangensis]
MKKALLTTVFACIFFTAFGQKKSGFGLKAGLNYSSNGDYIQAVNEAIQNPDANVGYHFGVFGKLGNRFYLRPEIVYTHTQAGYADGDLKIDKLDVPVLGGYSFLGFVNVFIGPSFQYILNSKFSGISLDNIESNFTTGLNIGAGINLGKVGLEIRYERGFSSNEALFINTNITDLPVSRVDLRPEQVIFSLSYMF